MKKFILCFALTLTSLSAQVKTDPKPLWGADTRTEAEKKTALALKTNFLKAANDDLGKAIDIRINEGWKAISSGNFNEALNRFNEAYALSPKDYRIAWGHAAALASKGEFNQAKKLFDEALKLSPDNGRLNADYALLLMRDGITQARAQKNEKAAEEKLFAALAKSEKYVEKSMQTLNSGLPHSRRAIIRYYRGDYKGAWEDVHAAQNLDGEGLETRFVDDLKTKFPEPPRPPKPTITVATQSNKVEIEEVVKNAQQQEEAKNQKPEHAQKP